MRSTFLIVIIIAGLAFAEQNDSLFSASCPLENVEFEGQFWGSSSEQTWQGCGKKFQTFNANLAF